MLAAVLFLSLIAAPAAVPSTTSGAHSVALFSSDPPVLPDQSVVIVPGVATTVSLDLYHPDADFSSEDQVLPDAGSPFIKLQNKGSSESHRITVEVQIDARQITLGRVGFSIKTTDQKTIRAKGTLVLRAPRPTISSVTITPVGAAPTVDILNLSPAPMSTLATIELTGSGFYQDPKIQFEDNDRIVIERKDVQHDRILLEVRTLGATPPEPGWQSFSLSHDYSTPLFREQGIFIRGGVQPKLTSLEPVTLPADESFQTLKINGVGLSRDARVEIEGRRVDASEIISMSSQQISVGIRVPAELATKLLNVRVINPDDAASNSLPVRAEANVQSIDATPAAEGEKVVYGRAANIYLKAPAGGKIPFRMVPYSVSVGTTAVPASSVQYLSSGALLLRDVLITDRNPDGAPVEPVIVQIIGDGGQWTGSLMVSRLPSLQVPTAPLVIHRSDTLVLALPGKRLSNITVVGDGEIEASVVAISQSELALRVSTKSTERLGLHRLHFTQGGVPVGELDVKVEPWAPLNYVLWNPGIGPRDYAWSTAWQQQPRVHRGTVIRLKADGTQLPASMRSQKLRFVARTYETRAVLLDTTVVVERSVIPLEVRVPDDAVFGQQITLSLTSPGQPPASQTVRVTRKAVERLVASSGVSALVFPTGGSKREDNVDVLSAASLGISFVLADRGPFHYVRPNFSIIGLGPEKEAPAALGMGGFLVIGGKLMVGVGTRITGDDRITTTSPDVPGGVWKRSNAYILIGGTTDFVPWKK